jgi:hypothetical protein
VTTTRLRSAAAVATVAVGLGLAGAGCSKPDLSGLTGSVSACYRAIPVATQAVHDPKARLLGVHRVPAGKVVVHLPVADQTMVQGDAVVCAVAFKGPFTAGQVDKARSSDQGPYAVVLVSSRRLQLVASFVLTTLPKRFQGRFT